MELKMIWIWNEIYFNLKSQTVKLEIIVDEVEGKYQTWKETKLGNKILSNNQSPHDYKVWSCDLDCINIHKGKGVYKGDLCV